MKKDIPFNKLSKKEQKKINAQKRGSWYGLNPVTRMPPNPRAYNRNKVRRSPADYFFAFLP